MQVKQGCHQEFDGFALEKSPVVSLWSKVTDGRRRLLTEQ